MSEQEKPMSHQETDTHPDTHDVDKERVMRIVRFAGLFLIIVVLWYAFDIASIG